MVASPPDSRIAAVFGGAVYQSTALPGPASYDASGRRYVFVAGPEGCQSWRYALDVEDKDGQTDPALTALLQRIFPDMPALQAWTVVECLAKLSDMPAHLMLRQLATKPAAQTLGAMGAEVVHIPLARLYITVARHALANRS